MLGVRSNENFHPSRRLETSPSSRATADALTATAAKAAIDNLFGDPSDRQIRSPDLVKAMKEPSDPANPTPPFNRHEPGSDAWYDHGKTYGIWVAGLTYREAEIVKSGSPRLRHDKSSKRKQYRKIGRVLDEAHRQLQALNDRLARLDASGLSRGDMQRLARKAIITVRDTDGYDLDVKVAKSGHDDFSRLYNALNDLDPSPLASAILGRKHWGEDASIVKGWASDTHSALDRAMHDYDIEPDDGQTRRGRALDEAIRLRPHVAELVSALPVDQQAEVWAYFHEKLTARLDAAEDELTIVRSYDWGHVQRVRTTLATPHRDSAGIDTSRSSRFAELATHQVVFAAQNLEQDLVAGTLRRTHDAAMRVISNMA